MLVSVLIDTGVMRSILKFLLLFVDAVSTVLTEIYLNELFYWNYKKKCLYLFYI